MYLIKGSHSEHKRQMNQLRKRLTQDQEEIPMEVFYKILDVAEPKVVESCRTRMRKRKQTKDFEIMPKQK